MVNTNARNRYPATAPDLDSSEVGGWVVVSLDIQANNIIIWNTRATHLIVLLMLDVFSNDEDSINNN